MEDTSMSNLLTHLRRMRGETSTPLVEALVKLIGSAISQNKTLLSVQVPSDLVAKGLTVLLRTEPDPEVWIYLARKEIPGYIPNASYGLLLESGWQVSGDFFGNEFASASKSLSGQDTLGWAKELVAGLEALGTPQRRAWNLHHELR